MPIFTLTNGVEYFYTDSGIPDTHNYSTYIIIHGHSFHSGVFKRLLPIAYKNSHRMIAINRRDYSGSTPYTQAELEVFANGSNEQHLSLLLSEGTNLALLLNGLIGSLSLPPKVVIIGWSLGNTYMLSMLASISESSFPQSARERLALSVHKTIMWDFPAHSMGVNAPPAYIPLLDLNLPLETRRHVYVRNWAGYYFLHDEPSKRNYTLLDQGYNFDGFKRRNTFEDIASQELAGIVEFEPGPRCDNHLLGPFSQAANIITNRALFDASTRSVWGGMKIWNLVGEATNCSPHIGLWWLEDQVQASQHLPIHFANVKGVNHFLMWDDPEACMKEFESCT